MTDLLLVYDIGTTSVKTSLFDLEGNEVQGVSSPYPTDYRRRCVEQEPEEFWNAAVKGTAMLSPQAKANVVGIGLSGHMNGALCIDRDGRSVRPELIHSDTRSTDECLLIDTVQQDGYSVHGNRVDEHLSLPKILWIYRHEKENYEKTAFFVNAKDFLRSKLTGVVGETDYSDASLSCAFDMGRRDWDRTLLSDLGLDPGRFPVVRESTAVGGRLGREAAAALDLKQGLPVALGGGDAACATRGAGVKDASGAYACIGSSAWISTLSDRVVPDEKMRLQNFFDLDGRHVNVCGTVQCTGIALDWILETLGLERQAVERHLETCRPGSGGILFAPYLLGERSPFWDSKARGSFVGLSLRNTPMEMAQSVYEGVAFALRNVLDVYSRLGFSYDSLAILGGAARSMPFVRMLANVSGVDLVVSSAPTLGSGRGAALAAMVAIGVYRDLDEAIGNLGPEGTRVVPEPEKSKLYGQLYPVFRALYPTEKPINDALYRIWKQEDGS
jgi:xylulokinase